MMVVCNHVCVALRFFTSSIMLSRIATGSVSAAVAPASRMMAARCFSVAVGDSLPNVTVREADPGKLGVGRRCPPCYSCLPQVTPSRFAIFSVTTRESSLEFPAHSLQPATNLTCLGKERVR